MSRALGVLVVLVALQAQAQAPTATPAPTYRLNVGGQVGLPFFLGVVAVGTMFADGRPRFDVDATWEPSVQLQSYSLGAAWHVLDTAFFVGGRLRLISFQPPWARGPNEPFFGMGLETGLRLRVGDQGRGTVEVALHGTFVPAQATNLTTLIGLRLGFSWSVFER